MFMPEQDLHGNARNRIHQLPTEVHGTELPDVFRTARVTQQRALTAMAVLEVLVAEPELTAHDVSSSAPECTPAIRDSCVFQTPLA